MPRLNLGPSYAAGGAADALESLMLQRYREKSLAAQILQAAERQKLEREQFEASEAARRTAQNRVGLAQMEDQRQKLGRATLAKKYQGTPVEAIIEAGDVGVDLPAGLFTARPRGYQPKDVRVPGRGDILANFDPEEGKYYDPTSGEALSGVGPIPPRPPQEPQGAWVPSVDEQGRPGRVNTITGRFILGPPTADMQNKANARERVGKSIGALKSLGDQIITRVGPRQRAEAMKRGAEAVFGVDPKFRTYQDARVALAGNLAVAQQGSRPSDVDVLRVWLPLVPDPYRDTSESAALKWEMINNMMSIPGVSGVAEPPAAPQVPNVGEANEPVFVIKDGKLVPKK